jgi:fused signal recognition particle receptor
MSFFKNIFSKIGLGKEESKFDSNVIASGATTKQSILIDHAYLEKLEEDLIRSDLGVDLSLEYSELIENKYLDQEISDSQLKEELKQFLLSSFDNVIANEQSAVIASEASVIASEASVIASEAKQSPKLQLSKDTKNIFLIVGVNGVGKTTSIGKLANKYRKDGFKTIIAAGDTFRAAAEAQLELWSKRAQVEIVQLEDGAKPSTVVFKALEKMKAENANMLLIDTAGRLQNKKDLMDELKKLNEVIHKNMPTSHGEGQSPEAISPEASLRAEGEAIHKAYNLKTMLVLDATTGSNAISQAQSFNEVTKLDGIILTKFDGSARAGVVFSLARKFNLPVFYIGTGEGIDDIQDFDLDQFIAKYL